MSASNITIIEEDTHIKGQIRDCHQIEIKGYIEGDLIADTVLIHPNGKFFGTLKTGKAEIHGTVQGNVTVTNLIDIRSTGTVNGNVRYGQIVVETGGNLSAELRNIPPEIGGDLDLTVERGKSARVTTMDLTALDPDDDAKDLKYTISNQKNGFVALNTAPTKSVTNFTQVDIEKGLVKFVHDGKGDKASFDVVVADAKGGTSGKPQTVNIAVRG